jgi:Protein of unknown function (DUF2612)
MLTVQEALNYYQSLLIIQYNSLPKASQTIQCLANCSVCDGLIFSLQTAFDLDTATGQQLAIIGRIVGVPYMIQGLDLVDTFMTFTNWNGQPASVGFNNWNSPVYGDAWASWLTNAIYTPTDMEMRALIQLKIMKNNYYPSLGIIVPALQNVFGGAITVVDNFNKTLTYNFKNPYHNVGTIAQFLGNIVPRPMGCSVTYNNI